jgi:hypothetical protein
MIVVVFMILLSICELDRRYIDAIRAMHELAGI